MKSIDQPELQRRTLRLYGELLCRRERWAGRLAFAAFPGAAAAGLAAAASLAGAVSLVVDSDLPGMKLQFRDGAFDFMVNTLDEALRAIKNEIRQGKPIAIGLIAEPGAAVAEAIERGLAADLLLSAENSAARGVAAKEAILLDAAATEESPLQREWLAGKMWSAAEVGPAELSALKSSVCDHGRGKWLHDLPAHQRSVRGSSRWVWLAPSEKLAVLNPE